MATRNNTPTGSLPTAPHMSAGHSRTIYAAMWWRSHLPKRQGAADYGGMAIHPSHARRTVCPEHSASEEAKS